jgi:hypothetical protein
MLDAVAAFHLSANVFCCEQRQTFNLKKVSISDIFKMSLTEMRVV